MRWSRHQADTPLGELLEEQPDEADPAATAAGTSDDDTAVRAPLADPPAHQVGPESDDSFLDDEDYLPQERTGPGRLTVALVAVLVLAVGVLGGVWVQKQLGTSSSAARFGAGQGAPGAGTGGYGTGGYGTGQRRTGGTTSSGTDQGAPGGDASGATGGDAPAGGAGGAATGGTGTASTPAVVGTVTTAGKKSLVVTDLGGTKHTVTLTGTTTVTTAYAHGALKAGDTVAVAGRAGTDGAVTATGITVS